MELAPDLNNMLTKVQKIETILNPNFDKTPLSTENNSKVLLMSFKYFLDCLLQGNINACDLSVVLILTTVFNHSYIDSDAFQKFRDSLPHVRIIVTVELRLCNIHNASKLKSQLVHIENIYKLPIFMSKDVLAMNDFGEEIIVKTLSNDQNNFHEIEKNTFQKLNYILNILCDIVIGEMKLIMELRSVVLLAIDVFITLGLKRFFFMMDIVQNTFSNILDKEKDMYGRLAVHCCQTQFDYIEKLARQYKMANSFIIDDVLKELIPYKTLSFIHKSCCEGENAEEIQQERAKIEESKSEKMKNWSLFGLSDVHLERQFEKIKDKTLFRCIVVTRTNAIARSLSQMINMMASTDEKINFLKAGFAVQRKTVSSLDEEERTESVLQAVYEGTINVLVTTVDLMSNISLTTFNILVYFGLPSSYEEYYHLKRKVRGLAPKLILISKGDGLPQKHSKLQVL